MKNIDKKTVESFGNEWTRFKQSNVTNKENHKIFKSYFSIFPFNKINKSSEGFDMGCGTGRWAKFIAPKVKTLNCIEPSIAIDVARKNLKDFKNIKFKKRSLDNTGLKKNSQDFGYVLGVLHHVPNIRKAIKSCVQLLKSKKPILIYIYYSFDNRPYWFGLMARFSNLFRLIICRFPSIIKFLICDVIALIIYFPIAKFLNFANKLNFRPKNFPLYWYRNSSLYVMRNDSRDRFGTPLEKRFSKKEIHKMMLDAGLEKIKFKKSSPFWIAIGFKKSK